MTAVPLLSGGLPLGQAVGLGVSPNTTGPPHGPGRYTWPVLRLSPHLLTETDSAYLGRHWPSLIT